MLAITLHLSLSRKLKTKLELTHMNNDNQDYLLQKAREKLDKGSYRATYKILAPLLQTNCAEALYMYSKFSFLRKETTDDFQKRTLRLLEQAASLGHGDALYQLAVFYDVGDMVDKNPDRASQLFKQAAETGHTKAKVSYGLDLFYGTNGIVQNQPMGLMLLQQAVDAGIEGAAYCLERAKDHSTGGVKAT
ncbi:tetratricopeptide repeat protein [Undibacterium sp. TJN19]|uniref:tetratricopeptide repeat protein n=1 Tax=Undibacterium sp. TJN19 TaxID=3413055 RepID=UPI003BF2CEB7